PSRASELRRSEPEHLASPCKRAETERTVDGRAPLVASFLESAHARRREMLCAPPDQPLVRVQAAACAPQNHQYQTSATMCRIRGEWTPEAAARTGAGNAWAPLAADPERGLVFVPTGSAAPDYYGGERPGSNRHANSVVALRAATGEVVWSFQVVHHDLWDYDVASQPLLADVPVAGRLVPAVIQPTKMGHVFV